MDLNHGLGGRPGRRISLTPPGSRPAWANACRSRNSIWALVLRSSSAAQRVSASWTAGSSRSRMPFRSAIDARLLVERASVDNLLGGLLAAQHHEQVGDHGRLTLLVQ